MYNIINWLLYYHDKIDFFMIAIIYNNKKNLSASRVRQKFIARPYYQTRLVHQTCLEHQTRLDYETKNYIWSKMPDYKYLIKNRR